MCEIPKSGAPNKMCKENKIPASEEVYYTMDLPKGDINILKLVDKQGHIFLPSCKAVKAGKDKCFPANRD